MSEPLPDPLQQMQLIDSMINKAKNRLSQNGHLYLLWGWTILFCSVTQFILEYFVHYPYFWVVWFLTWVMLVYQVIYLRRQHKKRTVITYTDEITKYVWIVFVITSALLSIVVSRFATFPHQNDAILLVMYGVPTFLCGIILKFKPLVVGAIACWALAIISLAIPYIFHSLLLSAAVIIAWIIPGYRLSKLYKLQNN